MFLKTNEGYYPKLPENNMQSVVIYTLREPAFMPNSIQKAIYLFPFSLTFLSIKYLIKLKLSFKSILHDMNPWFCSGYENTKCSR